LFHITALSRHYKRGPQLIKAVDQVDLTVTNGEFVAIVGSSGSGKSTLLNLMAGLDTPTAGTINFDGAVLSSLNRREIASYRAHQVGMVFQSFNLIHHRSALENVEMALYFNHTQHKDRVAKSTAMLELLGLGDRLTHRPSDLSGGEQQRVALARALVKGPKVLFADEPTGNLDQDNAQQISELLSRLNRDGLTIVMVTHNLDTARQYAHRVVKMHYGRIVEGGTQ
jgi:putative ABC transport system ATP-binding protein